VWSGLPFPRFTLANFPSYYGVNDGDVCGEQNGGPFPARWAETSGINEGYVTCTSNLQTEAKTLNQYNSNRIVAMNANMLNNDRNYWCGKEVQIFGPDGNQITIDEGPFILYDGCAACTSAQIIDVSALAFTKLSGGKCGNNPEGFTVKVIDNDLSSTLGDKPRGATTGTSVYNPPAGGDSAPAPQQPSSSSEAAPSPTPSAEPAKAEPSKDESTKDEPSKPAVQDAPTGNNLAAAAPAAAEQPASSPAAEQPAPVAKPADAPAPAAQQAEQPAPVADACKYGKWRCDGLRLQICNRATTGFAWETIASCAAECSFTVSGSAICQ
jgi:hypothetical protein